MGSLGFRPLGAHFHWLTPRRSVIASTSNPWTVHGRRGCLRAGEGRGQPPLLFPGPGAPTRERGRHVFSERTAMFLGAILFVWVAVTAKDILTEAWAHTHPDSTWAHALVNLKDGVS